MLELKEGRERSALIGDYDFFCGVLFVMHTGISWRDLPDCYGYWHTIYTRFKRWSEAGWFWKLLQRLQAKKLIKVDFIAELIQNSSDLSERFWVLTIDNIVHETREDFKDPKGS